MGHRARHGDGLRRRHAARRGADGRFVPRLHGGEESVPHAEEFGKGAIEGVAAPESANNAGAIAAMVPMLTLGIPGSATTAIMLGGLMMWGCAPGRCCSRRTRSSSGA